MADPTDLRTNKNRNGLNRIVVEPDLTVYTDRALDRTVVLAEENRVTTRFLHAVDPILLPERYVERDVGKAQRDLEQEVRSDGIDMLLDISVKVGRGDADKIVVDEAKAMKGRCSLDAIIWRDKAASPTRSSPVAEFTVRASMGWRRMTMSADGSTAGPRHPQDRWPAAAPGRGAPWQLQALIDHGGIENRCMTQNALLLGDGGASGLSNRSERHNYLGPRNIRLSRLVERIVTRKIPASILG